MVTTIITIVNNALEKVRETPIQPSEFDSGYQSHHMLCRQAISDCLKEMAYKRKDAKLKQTFDINTVASQAVYSLGFDAEFMADTDLRFITAGSTGPDYFLNYLTETEALEKYIDFDNLTAEEKPTEWWFQTTSSAGVINLRLNPIPDDVYIIRGMRYVSYTAVNAISLTTCSEIGDQAIQTYVAAKLANELQKANSQDLAQLASQAWGRWLAEDFRVNEYNRLITPYQQ